MNLIWGAILGVIYSKTYDLIPGKAISKGLIFGMIIALITNVRDVSFWLPFGLYTIPSISWSLVGFFQYVSYGLILGILYQTLLTKYRISKEKLKINTYDVSGGLLIGAIAGLTDGVVSSISDVLGTRIGLFPATPIPITPIPYLAIIGQTLLINMIWGTILGVVFVNAYDLIPGKGILKGICFSLIFFLISSLRMAVYFGGFGDMIMAWSYGFVGFFGTGIAFGVALGYLYKK